MKWNARIKRLNSERNERLQAQLGTEPRLLPGDDESKRLKEDFEYWAWRCARIRHKKTRRPVPFVLNRAQRKVLAALEEQRRAGKPMRVIVLKSRQWGCSTLICHYMMWLQLQHGDNLHSLVCAHTKSAATVLRGNYSNLVRNYPEDLGKVKLKRFEGLDSVRILTPGNSHVTVCSARNPDSARGADYAMAHLSEVSYWPSTPACMPGMIVSAVVAAIMPEPGTLVVMESTANSPGDFFHTEWQNAVAGRSDMTPVFAGWHDVDYNCMPLPAGSERKLWSRFDAYEQGLWKRGLTLEQIYWYHLMARKMSGDRGRMMREYPTTVDEAFSSLEHGVFCDEWLERARKNVRKPDGHYEVSADGALTESPSGRLSLWARPCDAQAMKLVSCCYIVSVDVGGNWEGADWSVITVVDVRREGMMEVVAEWRGHTDIDLLCATAITLGRLYHNALLVVESNSLESRGPDALERIGASGYPNLYRRRQDDTAGHSLEWRIGFHTNSATKPAAINDLAIALRDGTWIERSATAVGELATYVRTPRGGTEAAAGCHDDMVMTRAIAAYVRRQQPPQPLKLIKNY